MFEITARVYARVERFANAAAQKRNRRNANRRRRFRQNTVAQSTTPLAFPHRSRHALTSAALRAILCQPMEAMPCERTRLENSFPVPAA